MAKVFLDTNIFIDAIHRKPEAKILESLEGYFTYISPLSLHIYCYLFHISLPNDSVTKQKDYFKIVDLTDDILTQSLVGPISDFEDNVQLNSAAKAACDFFLTNDKQLLKMGNFGSIQIINTLA